MSRAPLALSACLAFAGCIALEAPHGKACDLAGRCSRDFICVEGICVPPGTRAPPGAEPASDAGAQKRLLFLETFQELIGTGEWSEGETYGDWIAESEGTGVQGVTSAGFFRQGNSLQLRAALTRIATCHTRLVSEPDWGGEFRVDSNILADRTVGFSWNNNHDTGVFYAFELTVAGNAATWTVYRNSDSGRTALDSGGPFFFEADTWQRVRIRQDGPRLTVALNDTQVDVRDFDVPLKSGLLCLESSMGNVDFDNIFAYGN